MRDVEVEDGEQESERDANAARDAGPSGGWAQEAGFGRRSQSCGLQKLACCGDDLGRLNGEKSFVGFGTAAMAGDAVGTAKDDAGGSKWSVARGIRRAEDSDNRNAQRGGEMHRASVSANEKLARDE